jgi:hypothetical protein
MLDDILLAAVLVMLMASTFMAWNVQRALYHSRKSMDLLISEYSAMTEELWELKGRVLQLEATKQGEAR